jgi:hypothetical protein
MGAFTDTGLAAFLIIVVLIGGAGGTLTARAVARAWRPWWRAALWMVPLAAAVRFVQFALFQGDLAAVRFYLVDLAILLVVALIAHRRTRTRQMLTRYGWLYRPAGALGWRDLEDAARGDSAP